MKLEEAIRNAWSSENCAKCGKQFEDIDDIVRDRDSGHRLVHRECCSLDATDD